MVSLCSCKEYVRTTAPLENYYLDFDSTSTTISLSELKEFEVLNYSEIYDNVKMIQLETSEESIIGRVSKAHLLKNGNLLIFDRENKKILLFDENGFFLNKIGEYGKGEQEYQEPVAVVYDKYLEEVIVLDHNVKTLKFFDINGVFLRSVKLPWWVGTFCVLDEEHLVLYMNYWEDPSENVGYNIRVIKKNGEVVSQGMQYNGQALPLDLSSEQALSVYCDTILCNPMFSSIIFEITKDSVIPRCVLDFGKETIPKSWFGFFDRREMTKKVRNTEGLCYCTLFAEETDCYVMNIVRDNYVNICIKSKKEEESAKVAVSLFNDMFGMVGQTKINSVSEGRVLSVIYPEEFDMYKKVLQENSTSSDIWNEISKQLEISSSQNTLCGVIDKMRERLESSTHSISSDERQFILGIDASKNPIIQIATLKQ